MVKCTCILYVAAAHLNKEMQKVEDLTTVIQLGVLFTVTHFLTLPSVVTCALHGSAHIAGYPSDNMDEVHLLSVIWQQHYGHYAHPGSRLLMTSSVVGRLWVDFQDISVNPKNICRATSTTVSLKEPPVDRTADQIHSGHFPLSISSPCKYCVTNAQVYFSRRQVLRRDLKEN